MYQVYYSLGIKSLLHKCKFTILEDNCYAVKWLIYMINIISSIRLYCHTSSMYVESLPRISQNFHIIYIFTIDLYSYLYSHIYDCGTELTSLQFGLKHQNIVPQLIVTYRFLHQYQDEYWNCNAHLFSCKRVYNDSQRIYLSSQFSSVQPLLSVFTYSFPTITSPYIHTFASSYDHL